jgi:large subunit ribosomal protein L24
MQKIKKNDEVIIIAGKNKGARGKVLRVIKRGAMVAKVVIEGVNLIKKHTRGNPNANQPGGIIEREAALDVSNVALFNPLTKKADKVGFKILDGKKVRYFKSNNELVEV